MIYTDTLINNYADVAFQNAFRQYFEELGCRVTNWEGLFGGMGEAHHEYTWTQRDEMGHVKSFAAGMNEDAYNYAWIRRDEAGRVVAFIQFTTMNMNSWFFRAKCGFIREFWVAKELRCQGHGSNLLHMAEDWLAAQGCLCILLTTDTAPDFYHRHGYKLQKQIESRNKDNVFIKLLA